jgi:hypothetical protein
MKINYLISKSCKGAAILLLIAVSAFGAFATLGDGKSKKGKSNNHSLLSIKVPTKPGLFSLQSGYQFRGSQVISTQQERYINLNTYVTYQQGKTTYVMPLKKKVSLNGKITFNPNAATRN